MVHPSVLVLNPEAMCIPAGYEGILSSLSSEQGFFFLFSLGLKSISCSRR